MESIIRAINVAIEEGYTQNFLFNNGLLSNPSLPGIFYKLSEVSFEVKPFPELLLNLYKAKTHDGLFKGTFVLALEESEN
jgi:hypothetical protein